MNEYDDLNLDRMREALLKLEVTQFAKTETQLAKEDLREHIRQELIVFREEVRRERGDVRQERRSFYAKVFIVATFFIGSDVWTMLGGLPACQECSSGGGR